MDTETFNGTYGSSPYNVKHHNLTQVGVYVEGEQISRKPLFLKFSEAGGQNFKAGLQSLLNASSFRFSTNQNRFSISRDPELTADTLGLGRRAARKICAR